MTALDINGSASAGRQYYQYKVSQTAAIDGDLTTSSSVTYDAVIAAFLETASSPVTIEPGVGSQPHTGQQVTCGLGIGMPDVP
jgi:hypothetical protein